jgi:hypothetical protein
LARNRYGWQKRAKEIARKQKNDDKMKRRQGKIITLSEEEMPETSEAGMDGLAETESAGENLPASTSLPD